MMKRSLTACAAILCLAFASAMPVSANLPIPTPGNGGGSPAPPGGAGGCGGGGITGFLGFRPWDACLDHDANGVPQFKDLQDIWKVALMVVEFFIKVSGYLAVGFIIWGGIKYLKSQGEPGETSQARQIINNALMGLVICLLSVAIVQFVAGTF